MGASSNSARKTTTNRARYSSFQEPDEHYIHFYHDACPPSLAASPKQVLRCPCTHPLAPRSSGPQREHGEALDPTLGAHDAQPKKKHRCWKVQKKRRKETKNGRATATSTQQRQTCTETGKQGAHSGTCQHGHLATSRKALPFAQELRRRQAPRQRRADVLVARLSSRPVSLRITSRVL